LEGIIEEYLNSRATTPANKELIQLMADGYSYAEIAEILGVNKRALYRRAQDIRRRMGARLNEK
ncbi:MAG: helix-turn-helix domain-containing protein, partial [Turicibacter sp.]|nr:helix-turn-helix domain-containing protein [Turicibacter sp.]